MHHLEKWEMASLFGVRKPNGRPNKVWKMISKSKPREQLNIFFHCTHSALRHGLQMDSDRSVLGSFLALVHPGWRNWFWLLNVKKSCPITECVPFLKDESLRFPDPVWPKPRWIYSTSQPCHMAFSCWARCSQNHSSGCWHQSAEGKLFIQLIIRSSLPPFLLCLHFSCTPLNMFQAFLWVTESAPHCIYHEDSKQVSAWLKVFESGVRVVGSWTWGIFVVPCYLSWPLKCT